MLHPLKRTFSFRHELDTPRILVCPSGFKESLQPHVVAGCIEKGIHRVMPNAVVEKAPLVDGGEGFTEALVASTAGELRHIEVVGPVGETVQSHFGFLGKGMEKPPWSRWPRLQASASSHTTAAIHYTPPATV